MINKQQEVFFFKLGMYDRKKLMNKKVAELNEDGWVITSVSFNSESNEYVVLADKVLPPPMMITMPDMTQEEAQKLIESIKKSYRDNKPIFLEGNVSVSRLNEPEQRERTVHVTREMLKRWREEDDLDSDEES